MIRNGCSTPARSEASQQLKSACSAGRFWPVNPLSGAVAEAMTWVDTAGGRVQVRRNDKATMTLFVQMAFFIEFLNLTGLLQAWIDECPLTYLSPNAPPKRDLLGTWRTIATTPKSPPFRGMASIPVCWG